MMNNETNQLPKPVHATWGPVSAIPVGSKTRYRYLATGTEFRGYEGGRAKVRLIDPDPEGNGVTVWADSVYWLRKEK